MVEVLVYKTAEEAKQELKKHGEYNIKRNEEFNDEWHKHDRKIISVAKLNELDEIKKQRNQKRYFVAELTAFPDEYLFNASSFPFVGENGFHKDISSLVQGVKDTLKGRNNNYPNIEVILYTVQNHKENNQKNKEEREAMEKICVKPEDMTEDVFSRMRKELFLGYGLMHGEARCLNQQEREEFVRLYQEK